MGVGALIIGDEILVGKRQDKHFNVLVAALAKRGMRLSFCEYVADDPPRLTETLKRTFASGDVVFSYGGIGATPDDHTRQCAGNALGLPLALHPEAEAEIRGRFGAETTPQRLKMGAFPVGSEIIPNPVNRIAGFSIRNHHFVPGFPQMAWPMMAWVLDHQYRELFAAGSVAEDAIIVRGAGESMLIDLMNGCLERHPGLKVFSLPHMSDQDRYIELGVRGDAARIAAAMRELQDGVTALGFRWAATVEEGR